MIQILAELLDIEVKDIAAFYYKQEVRSTVDHSWEGERQYTNVSSEGCEPQYEILLKNGTKKYVYLDEIFTKLWETRKK